MNESEDIMENEEIMENDAFDAALDSLDEQLEEHHDEPAVYDETAQEAIMYEEGVEHTPDLDEQENPEAASYVEQANDSDDFESHEPDATEALVNEETFEEYPVYEEEAIEEGIEESEEAVSEEVISEEAEEHAGTPQEATEETAEEGDFNLSTLTQLVEEIREESQRVSEMKSSVAEALQLIQEMSESLKS